MDNKAVLTRYVRLFTQALLNAGVQSVVLSPGSRSTPLAYAFTTTDALKVYMQVDERSAAYFALGLAKASGNPVVLLCTSGTAASNYYPAITEAHYARVPLIVITADRPHELREVGAPQAIDQIQMYGNHVKYSVDLPITENNRDVDEYIDRLVHRAFAISTTAPAGPVHLNVPFREPLLIDFEMKFEQTSFSKRLSTTDALTPETSQHLTKILTSTNGIVVAGEMPVHTEVKAFWKFAKALNWPVLCDPLSNLRADIPEECRELCIDQYDAMLKSSEFTKRVKPTTVLRFGAQPVSKGLSLFLKKYRPQTVIVVDESPKFRDPLGIVTHHIQSLPGAVFQLEISNTPSEYTELWSSMNEITTSITKKYSEHARDEGAYVQLLVQSLPNDAVIFSGSSMPIRDLDTFLNKTNRAIHVYANRGTNGIDGVVSTALGVQCATQRPTWLLIGDLSFLHDVNGLIISRFHEMDLTIVILNNDGGGIFSYLPQANEGQHFEQLFGTPTGLTFESIASMYGAQYAKITTVDDFNQEVLKEKVKPIRIIEVITDRTENVQSHRDLWNRISERLDADA